MKIKEKIKSEITEFKILLRSVPAFAVSAFVLSVVVMNLLANKSIDTGLDWLALDCGIIASWLSFLSMDVMTKHFGPKAATEISIFAIIINLAVCLIFFAASKIPGMWGEAYVDGSESAINGALDGTFGGTWYVLLGSTVAFTASAVINNTVNFAVGKCFKRKPDGLGAYIVRSYVSTAVGQFADNLIFAFIVSRIFFGWTTVQCLMCAATGMVVELLCEAVFSPLGFYVCKKWREADVGKDYFDFKAARSAVADKEDNEQ